MTMPALQVPPQPKAAGPRPRKVPLTPMRQQAAKSMSRLADQMHQAHPDGGAHQHVRDAARVLKAGNEEAAQRHLRAAIFSLTPQSLMRQGVHDDTGHMAARHAMHGVHRHLLLVKDIQDVAAKNQAAIRRDSYGDYESGPSLPHSPVRADPNAGYGPGALAQKPAARQPGGDRALNAPDRTNSGGSDPAVADPVGPQPKGSKQFGYGWDELAAVVELTADGPRAAGRQLAGASPSLLRPAGRNRASSACRVRQASTPDVNLTSWDDLAAVLDLSAETGRLAVTPAPYGKPGGPGLYDVKGLKHSDYLENIVHALMRKGMDKGKATAIARGSIRRWMAKSKHPEVRAAAAGAEAEELKAQARAHAHAVTWGEVGGVIKLAAAPPPQPPQPSPAKSANATAQPRVAAGAPAGGQFAPPGGSGGGKPPMDAHQQHVAHLQHLATHGTPAQQAAAKALLAKMAGKGKAPAAKTTAKTATTAKAKTAKAPAAAKAKTAPKAPAAAKTKTAAKATAGKAASASAKAAAHKAHVAHLQHLATHGNPAQRKAAAAILTRLGVKL